MDQSKKQKTTAEVSLKDSLSDWKEIVWQRNKTDHKFWEDSWNEDKEDWVVGFRQTAFYA